MRIRTEPARRKRENGISDPVSLGRTRGRDRIVPPKTREELRRDGYILQAYETCRGPHCRAMMEVWKKEGAKVLVMNPVGPFHPHSDTCPDRAALRKKGRA